MASDVFSYVEFVSAPICMAIGTPTAHITNADDAVHCALAFIEAILAQRQNHHGGLMAQAAHVTPVDPAKGQMIGVTQRHGGLHTGLMYAVLELILGGLVDIGALSEFDLL